jgi:hypothetical protein
MRGDLRRSIEEVTIFPLFEIYSWEESSEALVSEKCMSNVFVTAF